MGWWENVWMRAISKWFVKVFTLVWQIACNAVDRGTGESSKSHGVITLGVSWLIFAAVSGFLIFSFNLFFSHVYTWANKELAEIMSTNEQVAAVQAAIPQRAQTSRTTISRDEQLCDLSSGRWRKWLGQLSADVEDVRYFVLPRSENQVLLQYEGDVDMARPCEFVFIPRGSNAINFVVSYDGIYQLTVGDNDYWTVSLRAADRVGGALSIIDETNTKKTRPRLLSAVKQGSPVRVRIEQDFAGVEYRVRVKVTYEPEIQNATAVPPEIFEWTFVPSPALELESTSLSVGLIRAEGDHSEIGANFIYPDIGESLRSPAGATSK